MWCLDMLIPSSLFKGRPEDATQVKNKHFQDATKMENDHFQDAMKVKNEHCPDAPREEKLANSRSHVLTFQGRAKCW